MNSFNKILIANRGEIAVRIARTAKSKGYRTVAVYSDADARALHLEVCDQAVNIGPAPVDKSYLNIERILEAARLSGADAIHPGYGFLSENAEFARACDDAGITFIGPSPEAIELMGSKRLSKIAMLEANVPCIPGYEGSQQSNKRLLDEAEKIGFPLMVKASAGGGGRGMRLVQDSSALKESIEAARSEARTAFGNDELILEKALFEARHIEIQVFADKQGNAVYLGERDCSIQRRHQKVVEEAPSPFVDEALRQDMGTAAVNAARACHYHGAGTVEFLVDKDKNFYFLEMNTRLQVEHPVTELVTGLDLVDWQLKVAAGESLPLTQEDICMRGHAMEVRLYAEDPRNNFLPQTGKVLRWDSQEAEGLRVDHGILEGQVIGPHYDPMLAKIVSHGENREEARRRLACAVEDSVLLGVSNNKYFLTNILRHEVFARGEATTAFIEQHFSEDASVRAQSRSTKVLGLAAILMYFRSAHNSSHNPALASWRNSSQYPWSYTLRNEGDDYDLTLNVECHSKHTHFRITEGKNTVSVDVLSIDDRQCVYLDGGVRETVSYIFDDERLFLDSETGNISFINVTHAPTESNNAAGNGHIVAPMDGAIVDVRVSEGDKVEKGQSLVILEAMKMEHAITANVQGVVESLSTSAGEQVKTRQLLARIAPDTI